ncbi:MAG: cysteine-rich repeat protein [Myxococcota bacterium]|jgi:cysteine-rich repeat protein
MTGPRPQHHGDSMTNTGVPSTASATSAPPLLSLNPPKRRLRLVLTMLTALAAVICTTTASSARVFFSTPTDAPGAGVLPVAPTPIYAINEDGTGFTLLGNANVGVSAMALTATGELFAFTYDAGFGGRLVTIDPTTLAVVEVGSGTPFPEQVTGAAFDRDGRLWVIAVKPGADWFDTAALNLELSEFDIGGLTLTGPRTTVPVPGANGGDLAFALDGSCYFAGTVHLGPSQAETSPLLECDVDAGSFQALGDLAATGDIGLSGLAFSLNNVDCSETLLAADGHGVDDLIRVDPSALTANLIATTGVNLSWYFNLDLAGFASVGQVAACDHCGDGTVDPGEECDDTNTDSGDGCSSVCLVEATGGYCDSVTPICAAIEDGGAGGTVVWGVLEQDDGSLRGFRCITLTPGATPICDTEPGAATLQTFDPMCAE